MVSLLMVRTVIEQRGYLKASHPYINFKTKKHPFHGGQGETHLKLSLAYERKGTGFQSASKKSLPSKVEQEIEHFPLHGPQLHQGKSTLLNVIYFFGKGLGEK